jgi:hypothetical protein
LQSDDADHPTLDVPASGFTATGGKPRLSVNGNLNFGAVDRGAGPVASLLIKNTGLADLVISKLVLEGDSAFSLNEPASLTLAPGTDSNGSVSFTPGTWGGDASATISIESNDPRQPSVKIPVSGSAPFNYALVIGLVVLGAAVAVAGGIVIYEAAQKH